MATLTLSQLESIAKSFGVKVWNAKRVYLSVPYEVKRNGIVTHTKHATIFLDENGLNYNNNSKSLTVDIDNFYNEKVLPLVTV